MLLGSIQRGRLALQTTEEIISNLSIEKIYNQIKLKKLQNLKLNFFFFFAIEKFEIITSVVYRASLPLSNKLNNNSLCQILKEKFDFTFTIFPRFLYRNWFSKHFLKKNPSCHVINIFYYHTKFQPIRILNKETNPELVDPIKQCIIIILFSS